MSNRARTIAIAVAGGLVLSAVAVGVPALGGAGDTATLSGTITLGEGIAIPAAATTEDDGAPELRVQLYAADDEDAPRYFADRVDPDGSYSITGIEPGDYKLLFSLTGTPLASEWWDDGEDFADAQTLTLPAGEPVVADVTLDRGASVAGEVSGRGIPYGNGWVVAWRHVDGGIRNEGGARIGTDGTYEIAGLRSGTYSLAFTSGGTAVIDGELADGWQEWWGDAPDAGSAELLTLGRGETRAGHDVDLDRVGGQDTWPVVSGSPLVGQRLTTTAGPWPQGTALSYRWYADGAEIAGAKAATLQLDKSHTGKRIEAAVFGIKPGEAVPQVKFSKATTPVTGSTLVAATPSISGVPAAGSTLTAKPGSWTGGTAFAYQWYANGAAIAGATKASLTLGTAHKGKQITVRVTGSKAGFASVAKTSAKTAKVATAATPKISGKVKVGKKLTAKPGAWTSGTKFSYQWYANGKAIKGAKKATLTLKKAHKGKKITVTVTGKKSGYATMAKTSKATGKVKKR